MNDVQNPSSNVVVITAGLRRKPDEERAFRYEPVMGRQEASRKAVRYLVSRFFRDSPELLVLNLLENEELGQAELQRIRKLIAEDSQ